MQGGREESGREGDGIEPEAGRCSLKGCAIYVHVWTEMCTCMGVEVSVGI